APGRAGRLPRLGRLPRRPPAHVRLRIPGRAAGRDRQPAGPGRRSGAPSPAPTASARRSADGAAARARRLLRRPGVDRLPDLLARRPPPGREPRRPGDRRGVRIDDRRLPGLVDARRQLREPPAREGGLMVASRTLSPIALEVIEGSIRSAELEIEAAVERTA